MSDDAPAGELELREPAPVRLRPDEALPSGLQPSPNYLAAVELGHVLSATGWYRDATQPAQAAVKVMIGMDLGVSPTAAMQGVHTFEEGGKVVFLVEAKLLAAVVKRHPDVEYKILERSDEKCEIEFLRRDPDNDGEWKSEGPTVVWTIDHAKKAVKGFSKKTDTWGAFPAVMLTWRVLAEGIRLYFSDIIAGQPIYAAEEFDKDADELGVREAMKEPKAQPLTDAKAETLRAEARGVFDSLRELNPDRVTSPRFAQMVKNGEHSHEALQNVVDALTELRDDEAKIVEAKAQLIDAVGEAEAKPLIEAAERRGSQGERLAALEVQIEKAAAGGEGESDAD